MKNRNDGFKLQLGIHYQVVFVIVFLELFFSCAKNIYQKDDFPFYDPAFKLAASSELKTNGVYVLDRIWTNENGGAYKQPKEHRFYKFYTTGQCNLTLDLSHQIKTNEDYGNAVNKDLLLKNTLFEGYYKIENNKVVIQRRVVPRRQFEYLYGYIERDSLIIVKSTIEGKGKFHEKDFSQTYREYYIFLPLEIKNEKAPQW